MGIDVLHIARWFLLHIPLKYWNTVWLAFPTCSYIGFGSLCFCHSGQLWSLNFSLLELVYTVVVIFYSCVMGWGYLAPTLATWDLELLKCLCLAAPATDAEKWHLTNPCFQGGKRLFPLLCSWYTSIELRSWILKQTICALTQYTFHGWAKLHH